MKWDKFEQNLYSRDVLRDGSIRALRIVTRTAPVGLGTGTSFMEYQDLQLLTVIGWAVLETSYFIYDRNREEESLRSRRKCLEELQKQAAYLYER